MRDRLVRVLWAGVLAGALLVIANYRIIPREALAAGPLACSCYCTLKHSLADAQAVGLNQGCTSFDNKATALSNATFDDGRVDCPTDNECGKTCPACDAIEIAKRYATAQQIVSGPSVVPGMAAGAGATATISGTDKAGVVSLTVRAGATFIASIEKQSAIPLLTITWTPAVAYKNAIIAFSQANTITLKAEQWYGGGTTTTAASVYAGTTALSAAAADTTYQWAYTVSQP